MSALESKGMDCPCGSLKNESRIAYALCCEPFHLGKAKPDSAEKLMRSRYAAYVVGNIEYIAATNDPAAKDHFDRDSAEAWSKTSEWLGLTILATQAGMPGDESGEVEFTAKYQREGKLFTHHEVSLFKKINSKWFYVDGKEIQEQIRRSEPKIGRNDPCSCGSGKKFKKCCG